MNFHGGNVHDFKKKLLDFSSNINPLGVPASFRQALQDYMEEFTKYPDIHYTALRQEIGQYLGVEDIGCIIPGNGAVELLYKAIQQSGKSRLITLKPTFSEYKRAAMHHGLSFNSLAAFDEEYQDIQINKLIDSADQSCMVVICNPNNPTGTLITKERLMSLAQELQKKDAMLLIDEAFMEFTPDYPQNSMLDQLTNYKNLMIVKAATKFFGMPGIRLGYAISHNRALLDGIRGSLEPWNVNTAAVIAGSTVLQDKDYITKSRQWIAAQRPAMLEGLMRIEHVHVFPSSANFHLVRLSKEWMNAWQLKDRLLERDILIRTPEGFEGLDGQYVRLAVKDGDSNASLLESLKDIFG